MLEIEKYIVVVFKLKYEFDDVESSTTSRYCLFIEFKVRRFLGCIYWIWFELEGLNIDVVYLNGIMNNLEFEL